MTRRAFTLIELLVVVSIVALLIAILLPSLAAARDQAKSARCMANMRPLSVAVTLYAEDNNGWYPSWGFAHGGAGTPLNSWIAKLGPEYCAVWDPNDPNQSAPPANYLLRCPSDRSPHWGEKIGKQVRQSSYASNYMLVDGAFYNRTRFVTKPSTTCFWVELVDENVKNQGYPVADHVHPDNWTQNLVFATSDKQLKELAAVEVALERHAGRANYAMLDGHVERLAFEKTFSCDFANTNVLLNKFSWFYNKYDPTVAR